MLTAFTARMPMMMRQPLIFAAQGHQQAAQPQSQLQQAPARHFRPPARDIFHYEIKTKNGVKKDQTVVESLLGGGQIFGKINDVITEAENNKSAQKPWVMLNLYELQNPELYPERKSLPGTPGGDIHVGLLDRLIKLHTNQKANVRIILDNSKQEPRTLHWDPTKSFKDQEKVLMEPFHNDLTINKLKAFNVPFLTYPKEKTLKNHVKLLMLNNRKAVVGGMNWGNHSAMNHDGAIYIEGPDVRNIFHKAYQHDWTTAEGDPADLPSVQPFRQGKIKVLQTSGRKTDQGAKNEVLGEMLNQIHKAKESVHAELFVLTHKAVVNALIEKHKQLKREGKEGVKLLVDEGLYKIFPNCRPGIQKLDDAGVPIRFYKENKSTEEKLHAKWAVFDRKNLLIGSANWSSLGLDSKDAYSKMPSDASDSAEEGDEGDAKIPYKTNQEIAVMIEDAPNVAENFAEQADYDLSYRKGVVELSKPVSWNKAWGHQNKSWADQPARAPWSPKRTPPTGSGSERTPSPKRRRLDASA